MHPTAPDRLNEEKLFSGSVTGMNMSFCRVLVIFTAFIVFIMATSLITIVNHQRSQQSAEVQKHLFNQVTTTVARSLDHHLTNENWPEIRRLVGKMLDHSKAVESIELRGSDGEILLVRNRSSVIADQNDLKLSQSDPSLISINKQLLVATAPVFNGDNKQIGSLVAKFNRDTPVLTKHFDATNLIITAIALGILCIALTFWLSRKISAPVERVIQGARELSTCNFKMRLAPT
ncbi:MAG: hypothetical protein AAGA30_13195, partial [Planctomycetota bacterium]